jgi:hypothetical protein
MTNVKIIHVKHVNAPPRGTYPVTANTTLEKVAEEIQRRYPGHEIVAYELGGLLSIKHPELCE